MKSNSTTWNPNEAASWADALGLIHVPMFGADNKPECPGQHAVLLDGRGGTFALSTDLERGFIQQPEPLSWSWSSDTRCIVAVEQETLFLRRWDIPDVIRRFHLPQTIQEARRLLPIIEKGGPPRSSDVVSFLLGAFRQVRAAVGRDDSIASVRLFILMLLGVEAVWQTRIDKGKWLECRTVADLLALIGGLDDVSGFTEIPEAVYQAHLGTMPNDFLQPDPRTGNLLHPSLLLRHASGRLFQEAHLVLEKESPQREFAGMANTSGLGVGRLSRDVRYTPASLARSLVEQSLEAFESSVSSGQTVTVLDPACGSGIFLQETLREASARGLKGTICLHGYDVSEIACTITRFCIARAKRETFVEGLNVEIEIKAQDALAPEADWGRPDLVVMNPPFIPWLGMESKQQNLMQTVMGHLSAGQPDLSMAFVWKAAQALAPAGILATIIPSTLLETKAGLKWREALAAECEMILLARFRGFGYFVSSLVEPAFFVLRKLIQGRAQDPEATTRVLIARETFEDAALRALRLDETTLSEVARDDYELFDSPSISLLPESWMPRPQFSQRLIGRLVEAGMTRVGSLFDVKLGANAGHKPAFVVKDYDFQQLDSAERRFFRPISGQATITNGRLCPGPWLFYPYGPSGPTISSEAELMQQVPKFAQKQLIPHQSKLINRDGGNSQMWWLLNRERNWQHENLPKLVSKYFGGSGTFAYDDSGSSVVLQGHAWLWRAASTSSSAQMSDDEEGEAFTASFDETDSPWAYLALLNSYFFESLLGCFCPSVQGGQFDLSQRFVKNVFLPDLSASGIVAQDTLAALTRIGHAFHDGHEIDWSALDDLVKSTYGLPASWNLEGQQGNR